MPMSLNNVTCTDQIAQQKVLAWLRKNGGRASLSGSSQVSLCRKLERAGLARLTHTKGGGYLVELVEGAP